MRNGNAVRVDGHGSRDRDQIGEAISEETAGRLRRLAGRIPPQELSEVWVFPPLDDVDGSDEFHLFTRRMAEGVFRVCAAEFATDGEHPGGDPSGETGPTRQPRVTVYGAVPEARVPRLVSGFRARLGDGREPLYLPIFGSLERWRLAVGADRPEDESGSPDGSSDTRSPDPSSEGRGGGGSTPPDEMRVVAAPG